MRTQTAAATVHRLMLPLPHRLRTLAAAAALALAAAGLGGVAAPAHAADNAPTPQPNLCAADYGNGHVDFYLPGEKVTDLKGNKYVCGPDGNWYPDITAIRRPPTLKLASSSVPQAQSAPALTTVAR